RERYYLPEKLDISRDRLRTIAGISEALHEYLAQQGAASAAAPAPIPATPPVPAAPAPIPPMIAAPAQRLPPAAAPAPIPPTAAARPPAPATLSAETIAALLGSEGVGSCDVAPSRELVRERVIAPFAEVTRYPREILTFDAGLEEDLGIDSVKL